MLRENGVGTLTTLEVFVPLFQSLLEQKGKCSGIVEEDNALYLEYIGLMSDIAIVGVTPTSRYYFLGFKARRLKSDFLEKKSNNQKKKNPKTG